MRNQQPSATSTHRNLVRKKQKRQFVPGCITQDIPIDCQKIVRTSQLPKHVSYELFVIQKGTKVRLYHGSGGTRIISFKLQCSEIFIKVRVEKKYVAPLQN